MTKRSALISASTGGAGDALDRRDFVRLGTASGLILGPAGRALASAVKAPAGFIGINALWIPGEEAVLRDRFTRAKALGLTNVRMDWEWRLAEPRPGKYDWMALDRLVRVAHEVGISLLPIVHYAPDWALPPIAKGSGVSELGPTTQAFDALAQFMVACVKRYGLGGDSPVPFNPIIHWQVWNEPNNKDFWGPAPEPARFAVLARRVATALAPYRDRIKIVHAGLSKADHVFLWQLWEADRQYGDTFDIMAVHPYFFDWWKGIRRPDEMDADVGEDGKLGFLGDKYKPNYLGKVFNLQLFMTLRGAAGKPIWITEIGFFVSRKWLGVNDDQQAQLMADTMSYIIRKLTIEPFGDGQRALPANVQRVYWFALDDYALPDGYGNFGIYRMDRTPRPSRQVLQGLIP